MPDVVLTPESRAKNITTTSHKHNKRKSGIEITTWSFVDVRGKENKTLGMDLSNSIYFMKQSSNLSIIGAHCV